MIKHICAGLAAVILIAGSCAAADDSTVLLPLGLFQTPGAFGSVWQTELAIKNTASQQLQVSHAGSLCEIVCPFPTFELSPGQALRVENPLNEEALASTSGLILHIQTLQPASGSDTHFNLRIRDLSRATSTSGTELPVVRGSEFTSSPIELLNIPVSSGFRSTLRVYAIEGHVPIQAIARVYDLQTGQLVNEQPFSLDRPADQSPTYYPAYAQLDTLATSLTGLTGDRIIIEVTPSQAGQQLFAFVSITNNETQDVTAVTPQ